MGGDVQHALRIMLREGNVWVSLLLARAMYSFWNSNRILGGNLDLMSDFQQGLRSWGGGMIANREKG